MARYRNYSAVPSPRREKRPDRTVLVAADCQHRSAVQGPVGNSLDEADVLPDTRRLFLWRRSSTGGAMASSLSLTPISPQTKIDFVAEVAQSVEHSAENAGVVSSILTLGIAGSPLQGQQSETGCLGPESAGERKWRSGSASPCQGEGRGFKSHLPLQLLTL